MYGIGICNEGNMKYKNENIYATKCNITIVDESVQ